MAFRSQIQIVDMVATLLAKHVQIVMQFKIALSLQYNINAI